MAKVLISPVLAQWFSNLGVVLDGGLIYTFEGGTDTPATTWTSSTGSVAQANPIVLDSTGRELGGIWVTKGTAYKFILKTPAGVTIETLDNIVIGVADTTTTTEYEISLSYAGTPAAQAFMGGHTLVRDVDFPVDFSGSDANIRTNPGATYVVTVKQNGVTAGTVTFDTLGVPTFATSGGSTISGVTGDYIDFYGPDVIGTGADFSITLVGTLA